jgi:hypothetical protein
MDITALFELAPPVVLLLALNVLGLAIKKSPLPDWAIVWVLPLVGMGVYPHMADWSGATSITVKHPAVLNAMYGVCIGGAAVWGNQFVRQMFASKKPDALVNPPATTPSS